MVSLICSSALYESMYPSACALSQVSEVSLLALKPLNKIGDCFGTYIPRFCHPSYEALHTNTLIRLAWAMGIDTIPHGTGWLSGVVGVCVLGSTPCVEHQNVRSMTH